MKRSFPVNINNTIFYIDEDAYSILNTYLDQLKQTFSSPDEAEIVDDIEARIHEHFTTNVGAGNIINADHVKAIIDIMGSPNDISGNDEEMPKSSQTPPPFKPQNIGHNTSDAPVKKKLYRDVEDAVFGGVLAGLSKYINHNVTLLRLATVALAFLWGSSIFIYIIAWIVIPPANTPRKRLEMDGIPVTPDNIARNISDNIAERQEKENSQSAGPQSVIKVLANVFMGIVGVFSGFIGVATLLATLILLGLSLGYTIASPEFMDSVFNVQFGSDANGVYFAEHGGSLSGVLFGSAMITLAVALPALAVVWTACCVLFRAKGPSKGIIITAIVIELIAIATAVIALTVSTNGYSIPPMPVYNEIITPDTIQQIDSINTIDTVSTATATTSAITATQAL